MMANKQDIIKLMTLVETGRLLFDLVLLQECKNYVCR